jgi:DNA modification methylase
MMSEWTVIHGDCIDVMRSLPSESVDAVFTSPPYAMQRKATYGGVPESDYPAWTVAWMSEARRLLKPDGSVVINIRPHIKGGQISDYVLRTRLALRESGWVELEELIWHKKGGAPLGSTQRPRRAWESLLWYGKHGQAFSAPKEAGTLTTRIGLSGGRAGAHIGSKQFNANGSKLLGLARVADIVSISTRLNADSNGLNDHPAPFPPALAEWVGKLICPPGGTILDPFSGSGSTGVAAVRNGWDYIGIDAVSEYVEMSRLRLAHE